MLPFGSPGYPKRAHLPEMYTVQYNLFQEHDFNFSSRG